VPVLRTTRRSRTRPSRRLSKEGATYREPIRKYLEQEISAAHSVDLVIYAFDYAIVACVARDAAKASKSLNLLEQSLNPHAFPELGHALAGIYRFCRTLLGEERFDEALLYLRILRSAWIEVKEKA
jgi:hypothetical protein